MLDLESQIASWRRDLRASGIDSSATLDELEDHLRDDVEQQIKAGTGAQLAFARASSHIGPPVALKEEFQYAQLTQPMNRTYLRRMLVVIALVAVALSLILPALAKVKAHQEPTYALTDVVLMLVIAAGSVRAAVWLWNAREKA